MHDKTLVAKWVKNGIDSETITKTFDWGKTLVEPDGRSFEGLTTSQIRTVFGELKRIQLNGYKSEKTSFLLLKPKLAYAVKRHKKKGIELFYRLFSDAYDAVDSNNDEIGKKQFENLMDLMEAILAYHKFHGGKE